MKIQKGGCQDIEIFGIEGCGVSIEGRGATEQSNGGNTTTRKVSFFPKVAFNK